MDKVYIIEWMDNGIGDFAYVSEEKARIAILEDYVKDVLPDLVERKDMQTIIQDFKMLTESNYIEDYAWIISCNLVRE